MPKVVSLPVPTIRATPHAALRQFFADMFAGIQEGREIAVRYHALTRLSQAELASRGLTRRDISQAAVTGIPREPQRH